ncbi:MAG: 50S ribosomal protein L16 [Candidatus Pacearchaeota archaeon]|nr:50S ribosomal protein L16 [Candidatus Pacearchaeota archaeon]MDE1848897.1 50S ribosomal protein L16 [Nanoarchaeota archaeon]
MGLRKASAYSRKKVVPYTRKSKQKRYSYVKVVPPSKIVKFTMGDLKGFREGKFPYQLTIVSSENIQIRHNSLEACRQYINKELDKTLLGKYLFRIFPYPHHIQRENKMLTGAGADRMQTGMQLSFGKSVGRSAILKPGSKIFFFAVGNENALRIVRNALREIKPKMPGNVKAIQETKLPDNVNMKVLPQTIEAE